MCLQHPPRTGPVFSVRQSRSKTLPVTTGPLGLGGEGVPERTRLFRQGLKANVSKTVGLPGIDAPDLARHAAIIPDGHEARNFPGAQLGSGYPAGHVKNPPSKVGVVDPFGGEWVPSSQASWPKPQF